MDGKIAEMNSGTPEEQAKELEFVFLSDDPVTEDEFGTHKRVAESIAATIKAGSKGMMVGLEGTWGSGKSSVVKMLDENWREDKNIRMFTFDAWAHQGDPLRRAFLEELISHLQIESGAGIRWLQKKRKQCDREDENCRGCGHKKTCRPDMIRDELRQRREHHTIKTEPTITGRGIWFAIFTLLMPVAISTFLLVKQWWLQSILMALVLVPPIMILITWLRCLRSGEEASSVLGEFFGKSKEVTSHSTMRSVDPTSIEFCDFYIELLEIALKDQDRKLVIVLDNLDRVETKTALGIWGTMRTFLEPKSNGESDHANKIWVIIPYDPSAIEGLWDDEDRGENPGLAFKEKTFQVRYRIAEPLTSKWEDYFKKKLKEACPHIEEEVVHSIYHIFSIKGLPRYKRGIPTPREMKLYINRIVALAQQRHPEITLEEIALYAAIELADPELFKKLATVDTEKGDLSKELAGENWKEGVAAMHYGVKRKDANEVLYTTEIDKCLENGDAEGMRRILENPGGSQACERVILRKAQLMGFAGVLLGARAFRGCDYETSDFHVTKSVKYFGKNLMGKTRSAWVCGDYLQTKNVDDLIRVLRFDEELRKVVPSKLSILLPDDTSDESDKIAQALTGETKESNKMIKEWVGVVCKVITYLKKETNVTPRLNLKMPDGDIYLAVLQKVIEYSNGKELLEYFCPVEDVQEKYLKTYLAKIGKGEIGKNDIHLIRGFLKMACYQTDEYKQSITSTLEAALTPTLDHVKTNELLTILFEMRHDEPKFEEKLRSVVESGHVFESLEQHHGQASTAGLCLCAIFMYYPSPAFEAEDVAFSGQKKYREYLKESDENTAKEAAGWCRKFDLLEEISESVEGSDVESSDGMSRLLERLVSVRGSDAYVDTEKFFRCHSLLRQNLDEVEDGEVNHYEKLVEGLLADEKESFLARLQEEVIKAEFGHVYHIALSDEDSDTTALEEKLSKGLKSGISGYDWVKELKNEWWMLDTVVALVEAGCKIELASSFGGALLRHIELLLDGSAEVGETGDYWGKLLGALSTSERTIFRRQFLKMIMAGADVLTPILPAYGDELQTSVAKAQKSIRKRFVEQNCVDISSRKNPEEQGWIVQLLHSKDKLLREADDEVKVNLKDRLQEYLVNEYSRLAGELGGETAEVEEKKAGDEERLGAIEFVARELGITLQNEEDIEEEGDTSKEEEGGE